MAKPQNPVQQTINGHTLIDVFDFNEDKDEAITVYVLAKNVKNYYNDKNSLEAVSLGKALGVL